MDAVELARMIREGKVTSKELVLEAIDKIEQQNAQLNAVVHKRYEEAIRESESKNCENKPFGGVPILLKGLSQPMANMPVTSGSRLFANAISKQSNYFVNRLLEAGFIILGLTNVPEFGFKNITDSSLYGDAKNPLDITRTPGGSSGGSAGAVAAGWVPLAGASDGGGSIRIPASYTGLIGLKPSRGRIITGPGSMRGWGGASIPFALTKTVRDTKQLLYILEGNQAESPYTIAPMEKEINWRALDFTKLRIGYTTESPVGSPVSSDAVEAVEKTIAYFQSKGATVEEAKPDYDGIQLIHAYYTMNGAETASMMRKISHDLGRELTQADMETMTWAIYQYGEKLSAADYVDSFEVWDDAAKIMTDYHQSYDLFLTPTTAEVAPLLSTAFQSRDLLEELQLTNQQTPKETLKELVYTMFEKSLALTPFTQLANLTGQPAISLPVYRNKKGLPLGIQLMALKGNDAVLLQVAQAMEADQLFDAHPL